MLLLLLGLLALTAGWYCLGLWLGGHCVVTAVV